MQLLRTFAPWLLLAFLGQQVSLSSGARNKNRGADRTATPAPGRPQRSGSKSAATGKGKFPITARNMQCTWGAKDVGDTVRLSVKCANSQARISGGVTDLECEYEGKPQRCPGYQSDPKGFWKQVGRAFKRLQAKACRDDRVLVRAGMCKRAPRDAHFKLDINSSMVSAQSGGLTDGVLPPARTTSSPTAGPKACTGREQQKKKAQENCGRWASLCTFFFSMLQSDDC
ncbi:fibroblast growth factor-binding protein 1-like [Notolabrus celidotus]|uniref:fibroblast growth factor-binding protein 1-like n=1 Tax=Notolabrus celidotus TaxID=1203425 RepID=UPI00148F47E9|nr:fibroblast growth factor-binding protein 1-like [Notolabrus celidotus]